MALRGAGRWLLLAQQQCQHGQQHHQQQLGRWLLQQQQQQQRAGGGGSSGCAGTAAAARRGAATSSGGGGGGGKPPPQLSDEELRAALPSMLFTTGNLIWSTTLAVGVAAGGLLAMFWVGTFITGAARSLRHLEQQQPAAVAAPPPPKPLAELVAERRAELQQQLNELRRLPRTPGVRKAIAEVGKELRVYGGGGGGGSWWRWW